MFPSNLNIEILGKQNSLFPSGPVIKYLISHDTLYFILSRSAFWKKNIKPLCCSSLIQTQTICLDIRANVSRKQNRKSGDFFRDVNRSIAVQSLYMQIRVKLFVFDENAAKDLHLDHCQSPSRHMGSAPRKIIQ